MRKIQYVPAETTCTGKDNRVDDRAVTEQLVTLLGALTLFGSVLIAAFWIGVLAATDLPPNELEP